jgi:hypothetical protein
MPFKSPTVSPAELDEFLKTARERHAYALAADQIDRAEALDDLKFAAATPVEGGGSSQWTEAAIEQRTKAHRPILTENRLPTFIAQVVNDGRQTKPAIRITPLDGGNEKTSEMLQGRVRHIEYESDADEVYDTARKHQVTSGRGFIRITTKYKPKSREQEAWLEPIRNQFSVLFGPSKRYDRQDADYCYVTSNISKDEHERLYGKDTVASQNGFFANSECPAPEWFGTGEGGQEVQVTEYWLKVHNQRTRVQLKDQQTRWEDEAAPELVDTSVEPWEEDDLTMYLYILNGAEILDETEWTVPYFGIVPQWGDEQVVDGVTRTYSLIRNAKDPQRLINLYITSIAEFIAGAPKNPYKAPIGSIDGLEEIWQKINQEARAVVPYNAYDDQGRPIPPPEREAVEPPIQALVIGYNQAVDALKACMGMFDPAQGRPTNQEVSGIAIQRNKRASDNANAHFSGNEARTRKTVGRILLALIQKLDADEKNVPVRTEDGKTRVVRVNTAQPYKDKQTGEQVHHRMDVGEYAAAVSEGKSYTSQREEAFDTYSEIANADPTFMQKAGDILFRNLDAPGSQEIADRYEKALPPALQPPKPGAQLPPEAQAAMAQAHQMTMTQHAMILDLQQQLASKQPEITGRLKIAQLQEETKRMQIEAEIRVAELNAGVKSAIARLEQEIGAIQHTKDLQDGMMDRSHEFAMQQHQAATDSLTQQSDQQAAAAAAQQAQQAQQQQPQQQAA